MHMHMHRYMYIEAHTLDESEVHTKGATEAGLKS